MEKEMTEEQKNVEKVKKLILYIEQITKCHLHFSIIRLTFFAILKKPWILKSTSQ